MTEAKIHIIDLNGRPERDISVKGQRVLSSLDWSPDGKGLYAASTSGSGGALLHVDLDGNAQVLWEQKSTNRTWGVPSPDGKHLAILGQAFNSNIWMIEDF